MKKITEFYNKKNIRQLLYFLFITIAIIMVWTMGQNLFKVGDLLKAYEYKTYDLRVSMTTDKREINPNIVILSIDDTSIDVLEENFGRWPWSRDIYADVIEYLQGEKVDSIAFDLMFQGYQKGFEDKDKYLIDTITKYDNVYTSMNFDYREDKNPPVLPDNLSVKLENKSKSIDFASFTYTNANTIIDEIINNSSKVGFINFRRDEVDNTARRSPTFFKYMDKYYPYLPIKLAADYIKRREGIDFDGYKINKKNQLIIGNKKINLDNEGNIIINWYGQHYTYEHIPFWKAYKSYQAIKKGEKPIIPNDYLKDKIVFIGATAIGLYDIKSTPVSSVYPGVEIQTTVLNNILDNDTIKQASKKNNLIISLLLSLLVGIIVIKIREPIVSSVVALLLMVSYVFTASYLLAEYNLWIDIINPFVYSLMVYIATFIIKYVLKSKDFEYTYKLATTDGLTGLYNHRYFQEHLKNCMEKAAKGNSHFSIILIDIDFFKKFNDTYGHQAGDEVLRQVGQTLKKSVRSSDLVARYGGEEMVLVIDNANTKEALTVAENVCKNVANTKFELAEGLVVQVTISLGVATFPQHGTTSTELIELADQGLYKAKENGRNQVGKTKEVLKSIEEFTPQS